MKNDLTCEEFLDALADYLAGEVDEEFRELSLRHLAVCADCSSYLRAYESTLELLREPAHADEAPEAMLQDILAARRRNS